jgi:hypothetical protein
MNVYIYDDFLNDKKYINELSRIEGRLTDLGLNGKIARMGPMKNVAGAIQDELRRGAKTIIAVGNDLTINKTLTALACSNIPLGIIPIGKKTNAIAEAAGISGSEDACDILSGRRTEMLDLGIINENCFLSSMDFEFKKIFFSINDTYAIDVNKPGKIYIINLPTKNLKLPSGYNIQPFDGILQAYIDAGNGRKNLFGKKNSISLFNLKKAELYKDGLTFKIGIKEKALKLIVGKNRYF